MSSESPVQGDPDFPVWQVGYNTGFQDGQVGMRGRIIDFVTDAYVDPNKGPARGTPEADVYLNLLRRIGKELGFEVPHQ